MKIYFLLFKLQNEIQLIKSFICIKHHPNLYHSEEKSGWNFVDNQVQIFFQTNFQILIKKKK